MEGLAAELADIDLGDRRLNRRAQRLVATLGAQPTLSIPGACSGWDETRAAYRLFDHDAVTAEAVLAPHIACTEARLRAHPRVLCIQDTTELDYTRKKGVIGGLGVLNLESRWGMYLHPTLVVTPERVPLGLLDVHRFTREPGSLGQPKDRRRPLEDKESVRWVDGFARVNALAERFPETRPVYIADREGDLYDLFVAAPCPETGADWLIRAQHDDRRLSDGRKLEDALAAAPLLTEITFKRPAASGRPARSVTQQLKAVRVTVSSQIISPVNSHTVSRSARVDFPHCGPRWDRGGRRSNAGSEGALAERQGAMKPRWWERRRYHHGGRGPAAVVSEWQCGVGVEQVGLAVGVGMELGVDEGKQLGSVALPDGVG